MPELPEVETVARSLRPRLCGRTIVAARSSGFLLRRPIELPHVGGRVEVVRRQGKYLIVELSGGEAWLAHLGMSGRLLFAEAGRPLQPHTHAVLELDGGLELRYVDPRRFGVLRVYPLAGLAGSPELAALGPDPLEASFTAESLHAALRETRRELKSFLLDQGAIAGLGNIYACEALYRARLAPRRRTHRLGAEAVEKLHRAIRDSLSEAIRNRGTSFADYVDADGAAGGNQVALLVYGREGERCRRCKGLIRRRIQGARSTFYCPTCQK